jgi:hypothetical protein
VTCLPGSVVCADEGSAQSCLPDGSGYGAPVPCEVEEECQVGVCVNLCVLAEGSPSSEGCSFFTLKMDNFYNNASDPSHNDGMIVANPHPTKTAVAQLYFVANDTSVEVASGAPVDIPPLGSHAFEIGNPEIDSVSLRRSGGVYRLQSSLPVMAIHSSPGSPGSTNEAMLLLPEHAHGRHYVVASYPGLAGSYPSYFTAIGLVTGTTLGFEVSASTAAGVGVPQVLAGQTGTVTLDRFTTLNVVVEQQMGGDLSGTIVSADQPVWLAGATECANVPNASTYYCDYIAELMIPLECWGAEYVGAHAPLRSAAERFYWRVYGGADGVTVQTDPAQAGFPVVLAKGEFVTLDTTENLVFLGDGPFLPVQYLQGGYSIGSGDPAMLLAVPTEQYLQAYTFVSLAGYSTSYAQIVRSVGGAPVLLDGVPVGGFVSVGAYEVSNVVVTTGVHVASSIEPFGAAVFGFTNVSSYAFPAGTKLEKINAP